MTSEDYHAVWSLAGFWRGTADSTPYLLTHGGRGLPMTGQAVYIAEGTDGTIAYVGSTVSGARGRIQAHLREPHKARKWRAIWVVPLNDATPERFVRRIEGRIGARLQPVGNRRLPATFGP